MKPDTRLRRHSQLWQAGTASVRRVAAGGTIFAILILLRVVEPYQDATAQGEVDLKALKQTKVELSQRKTQLTKIKSKLGDIQTRINEEPWNAEIDELIKYFKDLHRGESVNVPVPQDKANDTIENIVRMVREEVILELREVVKSAGASEDLEAIPKKIEAAILKWRNDNYNKTNWYFTPESKRETIRGMSAVLSKLRTDALDAVRKSDEKLEELQITVSKDTSKVQAKIDAQMKKIDGDVDDILPDWAYGLVGTKAIVLLYPWMLVAIAAYLIGSALTAARHFNGMADEESWSADERSDPLLSSPWTLTWRGMAGTAITLLNYVVVLAALSYFLIRSLTRQPVTKTKIDTGGSGAAANTDYSDAVAESISSWLPSELAYGLMAAIIILVLIAPLRPRAKNF